MIRGQDAAGNWQKYEYDTAGRLQRVWNENKTFLQQDYAYGASRKRETSWSHASNGEITYYAWGGDSVIAEYIGLFSNSSLSWQKSYVYAGENSLLSTATNNNAGGETLEFHHPDRLGTKVISRPSDGATFEQSTLPFGTAFAAETTQSSPSNPSPPGTDRKFTSYDRSSTTGLDYAVNRNYSPAHGRFTQVDPIGMNAASLTNPQTLNMYAYCGNDPINNTDPDGLFFGWLGKKLWGFVKRVINAAVQAAIQAAFTYVTSGFNFKLAIAAFVGAFVVNLGFPKVGNVMTGWNPNASHPLNRRSGGGLNSSMVIRNYTSNARFPSQSLMPFLGAIANFLAGRSGKPTPCDSLVSDPGFQKFASDIWSKGNVNEAAGLIGLLVDDGSIPSSVVGLFQYEMWKGVGGPRNVGPDGTKWFHDIVNRDYGKIRYLFAVHTHPSGKGNLGGSRLYPSSRKNVTGRNNDLDFLIQLQNGMGMYPHPMGSGPYTQGVIITDRNFSVWDAGGKIICKGKW